MNDVRLVLRDDQGVRMEPHCHGKVGDPGHSGGDNRMFLERCRGSCGRRRRGATCRRCSATGTASSGASRGGRTTVFGGIFSRRWPTIPTSNR